MRTPGLLLEWCPSKSWGSGGTRPAGFTAWIQLLGDAGGSFGVPTSYPSKRREKMPSIRLTNVAAGTANALDGLQFQDIPDPGALISIYASTAVALGLISYSVGTERFLVDAAINIEIAVDAVDTNRDMVLDREPVPAGKQFLAVDAQVANLLVVIEDLPSG